MKDPGVSSIRKSGENTTTADKGGETVERLNASLHKATLKGKAPSFYKNHSKDRLLITSDQDDRQNDITGGLDNMPVLRKDQ